MSAEITPELLDEIERDAKAATGGRWEYAELLVDRHGIVTRAKTYEIRTPQYDVCADVPGGGPIRAEADAAHIARCDPPTVLALVQRIRELEAECLRLSALVADEALRHNDPSVDYRCDCPFCSSIGQLPSLDCEEPAE